MEGCTAAGGGNGVAQSREHEVDRGAGGIDSSVEVAPTTLDTNVGLIDTPGPMGWLEMTVQPLLQFWTVALDPAPDCRVVRLQAALVEQLFDIAQRERVPKVPTHSAKNQLGLRLSLLEDRRSDYLFHDLFILPAPSAKLATQPHKEIDLFLLGEKPGNLRVFQNVSRARATAGV